MGTCEHSPRLVLSCSCSGNRQTFSTKCTIVCHKPLPGSLETQCRWLLGGGKNPRPNFRSE